MRSASSSASCSTRSWSLPSWKGSPARTWWQVCAQSSCFLEQIYVVDLADYSAAAKGEIEMIALALRCITVHDAAAEAFRAIDVLQNGRKRSEGTVSVVQSVSLDVESNLWCANRLRTILLITVWIAQHGPILVSCLKDIGSASVTGFAVGVHERRCPGAAGSLGRFRETCWRTGSAGQS